MEESEYKERLKQIEKEFDLAKRKLYFEYGISKAKFKVGDTIKDSRWTLLINKVTTSKGFGLPEPVYTGLELKKDLTPRKDGSIVSVYGNHEIELIKEATTK